MNPTCYRGVRIGAFAFLAALGIAFLAAEQAQAQASGGMTRRGPTKGGRGKPDRGGQLPKDDVKWTDTGSNRCRILEFEPLKEGGDEDVIGILRIRPVHKKAKTLKLLVRKTEDLQVQLKGSSSTLDLDVLSTLPLKNVLCEASWGFAKRDSADDSGGKDKKKKSDGEKQRELRGITLETIEVEGTIESIEGDLITIKARPKGGEQWPDIELKQGDQPEKKGNAKAPRIAQRKLKLRLIDDVTKFEAGNQEALEFGDFKPDQEIEAIVVFGSKTGLMVTLRAPDVEGEKKVEPPPGERGPQPPGGRDGTRRGGGRPPKGGGI